MLPRRSTTFLFVTSGAMILAGGLAAAFPRLGPVHSPPATAVRPSVERYGWISPAAKKEKLLYVSDYTASIVLIYKQNDISAGPVGEIMTGISSPQGIAVDAVGTLYVANQGNNTVTEYLAGTLTPSVTLSSTISKPLDVSVDKNGILYVTEATPNTILEFKPGSTSPDATITMSHPSDATNARNGDLYVTYNLHFSSEGGRVARCKPLATKCKDLGISLGFANGIAIDSAGNLLVGDIYNEVIDIYAPGTTTPFRTIVTTQESPGKLAFDKTDTTLYMADPANFAVELYDYASGTQTDSFTFGSGGELEGVALFPGQRPGPGH